MNLDFIYPIGSIYMSVNSISPQTLFGGTWTQIKDRFLLACGDTYTNGTTGGEATHKLTVNEMPSHYHGLNTVINGTNPGDSAPYRIQTDKYQWGGTGVYTSTNSSGSSQPHNNMPPYLAVYIWKRTA